MTGAVLLPSSLRAVAYFGLAVYFTIVAAQFVSGRPFGAWTDKGKAIVIVVGIALGALAIPVIEAVVT